MKTRSLLVSLALALVLLPGPARAGTLVADWPMDTQAAGATDPNCPPPQPDSEFPICEYYKTPDVESGLDVAGYYRGGIDLAPGGRWGSALAATNHLLLQRVLRRRPAAGTAHGHGLGSPQRVPRIVPVHRGRGRRRRRVLQGVVGALYRQQRRRL